MATLVVPKYIPTPEEIESAKDEIHAARLAKWEANNPPKEVVRERDRQRTRKRRERAQRQVEESSTSIARANAELLEQETEADVDPRDPRQVEQWIPVPSVDDDRREASAVRHRREFYTRFFPSWVRITTQADHAARRQSMEWREKEEWKRKNLRGYAERNPAVPTWTIEPSVRDRTPREQIDDELKFMESLQRTADFDLSTEPCFIALQRRVLARYLWGIRREGRRVPKTPNWGYKLANQLMLERDETEPLDLFHVDPETVARVTHGVPQTRRDVIPFRSKRR